MKTMTCKQLKGACDQEFHADNVDDMVKISQEHGMEMKQKGDEDHIKIMDEMREKGQDPEAREQWMAETKKEFDALPEDK